MSTLPTHDTPEDQRTLPPSIVDVVEALVELGGHATAVALCDELVHRGYERGASQLAIQRACEQKQIIVQSDWTLRVPLAITPPPAAAPDAIHLPPQPEKGMPFSEAVEDAMREHRVALGALDDNRKSLVPLGGPPRLKHPPVDARELAAGLPHGSTSAVDLKAACAPWKHHSGPPPLDDSSLSGVFGAGMTYTEELLAKLLDVERFERGDGSEDFEADAIKTLENILVAAKLYDPEDDRWATLPTVPQRVREPIRETLRPAVEREQRREGGDEDAEDTDIKSKWPSGKPAPDPDAICEAIGDVVGKAEWLLDLTTDGGEQCQDVPPGAWKDLADAYERLRALTPANEPISGGAVVDWLWPLIARPVAPKPRRRYAAIETALHELLDEVIKVLESPNSVTSRFRFKLNRHLGVAFDAINMPEDER